MSFCVWKKSCVYQNQWSHVTAHRTWVCHCCEKVRPATACAPSSAPWLSWCFIYTSQWYLVSTSLLDLIATLNTIPDKEYFVMFINYHKFYFLFQGTGEGDLTEAETLLQPYTEKFPNVSILTDNRPCCSWQGWLDPILRISIGLISLKFSALNIEKRNNYSPSDLIPKLKCAT